MSNKKKLLILFVCLVIFFSIPVIYTLMLNRIPDNPAGTTGNTAGNLNNLGLYCELDGTVYFSNAYDNGALYCMDVNEENVKKLNNAQIQYINAAGKYLYYYQINSSSSMGMGFQLRVNGLYRCSQNGKNMKCLSKNTIQAVSLADNTLFYQMAVNGKDTLQLYSIQTDKSDETLVADYLLNPVCIENNQIYYNGTVDNHYLYTYDIASGSSTQILNEDMWYPVKQGDYVYYLDIKNNYRLCRYSLSSSEKEILTEDRVDTYNLCDTYIYYQKNSEDSPALMRMSLDGSNPEIVSEGIYSNINITSNYVYFTQFGSDTPVYHTPTYGAVFVSTFDNAKQAAIDNQKP